MIDAFVAGLRANDCTVAGPARRMPTRAPRSLRSRARVSSRGTATSRSPPPDGRARRPTIPTWVVAPRRRRRRHHRRAARGRRAGGDRARGRARVRRARRASSRPRTSASLRVADIVPSLADAFDRIAADDAAERAHVDRRPEPHRRPRDDPHPRRARPAHRRRRPARRDARSDLRDRCACDRLRRSDGG